MNIQNPLALALLMTASAASAQPNTSASGFNFNLSAAPSPFVFGAADGGEADAIFKCGGAKALPCTDEQRKRLTNILRTRSCPEPVTVPCSNYLMMNVDTLGVQLMGNQANPATANDEFFKKCGTVPYRNCTDEERADRDAWLKGQASESKKESSKAPGARNPGAYDQQPGFVGPPLPPGWGDNPPSGHGDEIVVTANRAAPKPPSPAAFERTLADAKKAYGDKVVDLGDKTYGILNDDDGSITVVGQNGSVKKDQSEYKDKIQQARAEGVAFNGTSGGGTNTNKTGGQTSGGTPPPADDDSGSSGGGGGGPLGRSFASDQASISPTSGDSSSSSSGDGAFKGDGKGYIAVKPSDVTPVGSIQITHSALLKTEAEINNTQRAFNNGQTGFAAPNDDTGSAAGDPPISPEHLGKIQAVENVPAQK